MAKLIVKCKYLKPGGGKNVGGYIKYIATREGVDKIDESFKSKPSSANQNELIQKIISDFPESKEMLEYEDYVKEPTIGNAAEFISRALEDNSFDIGNAAIYAEYIATRPGAESLSGAHGLFSDDGIPLELKKISEEINNHNGNTWTLIVSIRREDAQRLGFDSGERWRDMLRTQTTALAENLKIPMENLKWYAAFHNESHHPHVHIVAYSSVAGEGFLTKKGIKDIKSSLANDIFRNELYQIYEEQTEVRDSLRSESENVMKNLLSELQNSNEFDQNFERLVLKLQSQLNNSKGKKVYGYLKPEVKETVDQIVAALAKNPILEKMYGEWCKLEQQKYEIYTGTVQDFPPLEENKVFSPIKNAVIRAVSTMNFLTQDIQPESVCDNDVKSSKDLKNAELHKDVYIRSESHYDNEPFYDNEVTPLEDLNNEEPNKDVYIQSELHYDNESFCDNEVKYSLDFNDDESHEEFCSSYHMNWRGKYRTACGLLADKRYKEAFDMFQEEAVIGNVPAIYKIAKMYHKSLLGEENIPKAQEYFSETLKGFLALEPEAGKMQPYIWYHLGRLYNFGYGTEQDYSKAFKWFEKAALAENEYAQYSLGSLYYYGNGIEQDYEEAFDWFKRSADKNNAYACYEAAKMFRDGIGTEINIEESEKYFRKAYIGFRAVEKKLEDDKIWYRLGQMLLKGIGCEANPYEAVKFFQKSAEKSNLLALCIYGKMLMEGEFVPQNTELGIKMLKRSAEKGNAAASYALGKIYLFGNGVDRDPDIARHWLTISADMGNEYAKMLLERMDGYNNMTATRGYMLLSFGRLISKSYDNNLREQKPLTEHKLRSAIRRKKAALGIKEDPLENSQGLKQ